MSKHDRCLYRPTQERIGLGSYATSPGCKKAARGKSAKAQDPNCAVLPPPRVEGLWATTALVRHAGPKAAQRALCQPEDVVELVGYLRRRPVEEVLAIPMDAKAVPQGVVRVAQGTETAAVVSIGEVARAALLSATKSVVLVHNHPSGASTLSQEDRRLAARLYAGLRLLDVDLVDFIAVGERGSYTSMTEDGIMPPGGSS